MRALQAVAESYVGRNLTSDELKQAISDLQTGTNPPLASNFWVRDGAAVIKDALGRSWQVATIQLD
ncbi:MAG TPA: hypothetical protein PLC54_06350, partial [Spirochaetales bacterium]|nr:hypothetical protein [Spirochaetales bacterium]